MMSNLPTLPLGVSLTIEFLLLTAVLVRITLTARLHRFFREVGSTYMSHGGMMLDYVMILLGFCDFIYFGFLPGVRYRIVLGTSGGQRRGSAIECRRGGSETWRSHQSRRMEPSPARLTRDLEYFLR